MRTQGKSDDVVGREGGREVAQGLGTEDQQHSRRTVVEEGHPRPVRQ